MKTSLKGPLRVVPVRNCAKPQYPRAGAARGFDFTDGRRWPFSRKVSAAVLSAAMAMGCEAVGFEPRVPKRRAPSAQVVANPFAPKAWVPVRISGKGGPTFLPDELAVDTILAAFREEGVEMRPGVRFAKDGVTVQLTGYDARHHLGFVLLNQRTTGVAADGSDDPSRLDPREIEVLQRGVTPSGETIALIKPDGRFETAAAVAAAVHSYLEYLRQEGAL